MVFDKNFFLNLGLITFNVVLAFWPSLDYVAIVQLLAVIFIGTIETKRQLHFRKIARIRRQIALNQEILILEDIMNNIFTYPMDIFTHVMDRTYRARVNYGNNVNWKRDGF